MNGGKDLKKRINVVSNPNYQKAGMQSYASLLKKYDLAPTTEGPYQKLAKHATKKGVKNLLMPKSKREPLLRKVNDEGKQGEIKAEDQQNDTMYLCPVQVGTPREGGEPQVLNLDFDTGRSDLWVWSTGLNTATKRAGHSKHNIYDPNKSTTYRRESGSRWKIRYGDGSTASGIVGTDHVTLGGLCVENQAIELACRLSSQFTQGAGDGLLGLAFGKINTVKPRPVQTPVENMITQADIEKGQELFTCHLGSWRDPDDADQGESFYTFGYIDEDVMRRCRTSLDAIHYVPVDASKGFWQFASASASVDGQTIERPGNSAIADTGTTLALVSDELCRAIYDKIPGATFDRRQQGWTFPVGTPAAHIPTVTFAVGSAQFQVQKEDFGFAQCGEGMLYGGIQSRGDSKFDILGGTWLKAVYAIFDLGNRRFGCVQRIEGEQNLDAPN